MICSQKGFTLTPARTTEALVIPDPANDVLGARRRGVVQRVLEPL
jgi:hypothetical protein